MIKTYIIAVNSAGGFDAVAFHNFIKTLHPTTINGWWHYLDIPVYFVKSKLTAEQLYSRIFPAIPTRQFIVMEANVSNQQGWLPKAAWQWFKS